LASASQIKTLDSITTTTVNTTIETGQMLDTPRVPSVETNELIHTTHPVDAHSRETQSGDTIKIQSPFVDHPITTPGRHPFIRSKIDKY